MFNKIKVDIGELEISGHSLVGCNYLFYPMGSGNYFSLKFNNQIYNIMNMSCEDFQEIKRKKFINNITLVEVLRADGTKTNGYLLYSEDLNPKWYIKGLWTYDTNITIDEKQELIDYLVDTKYAINYLKEKSIQKEDIEQIIINKTNSMIKKHYFTYLNNENDIMIKTKQFFTNNKGKYDVKDETLNNIYYLEILNSMKYKFAYRKFNELQYDLRHESIDSINYLDIKIFGYSVFNNENKSVEHFIICNDLFFDLLSKFDKYEKFIDNCEHLSEDGIERFYTLLEKEKQEKYNQLLLGQTMTQEYTNIRLKQILNHYYGLEYIDYTRTNVFDLDLHNLVNILFDKQILTSNNEDYAKSKETKTSKTFVYFYELIIENIINENEFIARLSSNNNSFYYLHFIKENNEWNYTNVKRKVETIISYS